jgi:hypothetical protein
MVANYGKNATLFYETFPPMPSFMDEVLSCVNFYVLLAKL